MFIVLQEKCNDASLKGYSPLTAWKLFIFLLERTQLYRHNPLTPHNALMQHFTSLKTGLIFLQLRRFSKKFHETFLPIHGHFLQFVIL